MLGRFRTDSWGGKRGPGEKVIVIVWVGAKVTGGWGGGGSHGGGDVVAFWVWKEDGLVSWMWVLSGLRDWKSDGSREGMRSLALCMLSLLCAPSQRVYHIVGDPQRSQGWDGEGFRSIRTRCEGRGCSLVHAGSPRRA